MRWSLGQQFHIVPQPILYSVASAAGVAALGFLGGCAPEKSDESDAVKITPSEKKQKLPIKTIHLVDLLAQGLK